MNANLKPIILEMDTLTLTILEIDTNPKPEPDELFYLPNNNQYTNNQHTPQNIITFKNIKQKHFKHLTNMVILYTLHTSRR
jgi:hypothetical protein